MKVNCTGLVTVNDNVVTGIGTRFKLELRPYDSIEIDGHTISLICIYSEYQALVTTCPDVTTPTHLYIVTPNAAYLLPPPLVEYHSVSTYLGSTMYRSNLDGSILYGGQVFNFGADISMCTLNSNKAITLPYGYEYITPFTHLSIVATTANSTVITAAVSNVRVSTTAGSRIIRYISGTKDFVLIGACITIEGLPYVISDMVAVGDIGTGLNNTDIYLDKVVPATYSAVYMNVNPDLEQFYPVGTTVLLNGKLHTIARASGNALQVRYPISESAIVSIRRPLMGTQYSLNTTELFNIEYSTEFLVPGNIIILQDFKSEDSLFEVNSCYTEIKHISRLFDDNRLVTDELNGTSFSGLVCIGIPTYGLKRLARHTYCEGATIHTLGQYYDSPEFIGKYIKIDDALYKITGTGNNNFYTTPAVTATPTAIKDVYFPALEPNQRDYTDTINNLALKLVENIIKTGRKRTASINSLTQEFLSTWNFACFLTAIEQVIYSVYEPEYFAVNIYSAPPIPYSLETSVYRATSTTKYKLDLLITKQCGLPLSSKG